MNYLTSLDVMAEAEKTLKSGPEWQRYLDALWKVVNSGAIIDDMRVHRQNFLMRDMVFATAAQRAEAFLHCLNLWKEDAQP